MIGSVLKRYYASRVKATKFKRMLSIPKGKRVIDIGGGDGPFPRADVICEKFLSDDAERTSPLGAAGTRALVVGDIENLPFTDKSFDFVYCSHILEHTHDPSRAIAEITRIGKAGYIEVPSEYLELAAVSTPAHLWTIDRGPQGELVFRPKSTAITSDTVNRVFRNDLWGHDALYEAFHWKNYYKLFNIGVTWEGTIPHKVIRDNAVNGTFEKGQVDSLDSIRRALALASQQRAAGVRKSLKGWVTRSFTNPNVQKEILSFVACPDCKKALTPSAPEWLKCGGCRREYPYIAGVPVLLREHARPA